VYLNTIPIRNLSHRIKNGNRENRQPVETKSVKQHKATKIKLKTICGGQLSRGLFHSLNWHVKMNFDFFFFAWRLKIWIKSSNIGKITFLLMVHKYLATIYIILESQDQHLIHGTIGFLNIWIPTLVNFMDGSLTYYLEQL